MHRRLVFALLALVTLTGPAFAQTDPGKRTAPGALHPTSNPVDVPQHTACSTSQPGR